MKCKGHGLKRFPITKDRATTEAYVARLKLPAANRWYSDKQSARPCWAKEERPARPRRAEVKEYLRNQQTQAVVMDFLIEKYGSWRKVSQAAGVNYITVLRWKREGRLPRKVARVWIEQETGIPEDWYFISAADRPKILRIEKKLPGWVWKRPDVQKATKNTREHRRRHPLRAKARISTTNALRRGDLVRPDVCSCCGVLCAPHAHHEDYTKPLEIMWLCPECHRKMHGARK